VETPTEAKENKRPASEAKTDSAKAKAKYVINIVVIKRTMVTKHCSFILNVMRLRDVQSSGALLGITAMTRRLVATDLITNQVVARVTGGTRNFDWLMRARSELNRIKRKANNQCRFLFEYFRLKWVQYFTVHFVLVETPNMILKKPGSISTMAMRRLAHVGSGGSKLRPPTKRLRGPLSSGDSNN
jgi:hypothetical protein